MNAILVPNHRPGALLVRYQPWAEDIPAARLLPTFDTKVEGKIEALDIQRLRVAPGEEERALAALRTDPRVGFAEYDYSIQASEVITPNDPDFDIQWSLQKIQAQPGWEVTTGSPEVVIAILDTGIQRTHPDLAEKVWVNTDEIPLNWIDDDGNGKVDDRNGWHFFHAWNGSEYIPRENRWVDDDNGHGSHISGIAAAASNNATGIAGIDWGARIMAIKVLDQYGGGWYSDIAAGMVYAAENGARVINLSAGGPEPSQTLQAAVDYANALGALVVAASGNDGVEGVLYPAAYLSVVAVAASDDQDLPASFSNFGPQIDLSAPGVNIYSTWYKSNYITKSGTSMATPHVSGVAALVWSLQPFLGPQQVADLLIENSDDIGEPGFDEHTGWGRVNTQQTLQAASSLPHLWRTSVPVIFR